VFGYSLPGALPYESETAPPAPPVITPARPEKVTGESRRVLNASASGPCYSCTARTGFRLERTRSNGTSWAVCLCYVCAERLLK